MSLSPLKRFYTVAVWHFPLHAIDVMIMLKICCTVSEISLLLLVFEDPWGIIVQLSSRNYTLIRGSKKVFVSRTLTFLWQVSGVFRKHGMQCALVMSRLAIINRDIMLGAILVLSRRPWVIVFSLAISNAGPLGTLPLRLWWWCAP